MGRVSKWVESMGKESKKRFLISTKNPNGILRPAELLETTRKVRPPAVG